MFFLIYIYHIRIEGITKKDLSRLHHHLKEKMITIFSTFREKWEMRRKEWRNSNQSTTGLRPWFHVEISSAMVAVIIYLLLLLIFAFFGLDEAETWATWQMKQELHLFQVPVISVFGKPGIYIILNKSSCPVFLTFLVFIYYPFGCHSYLYRCKDA